MKEVTVEDKGDYQCIVTNVHGSLNFTFIVEVISKYQGFHYFASPSLFIKIGTIFMNILYNTVKSEGTKDHFRWVKVPGNAPY